MYQIASVFLRIQLLNSITMETLFPRKNWWWLSSVFSDMCTNAIDLSTWRCYCTESFGNSFSSSCSNICSSFMDSNTPDVLFFLQKYIFFRLVFEYFFIDFNKLYCFIRRNININAAVNKHALGFSRESTNNWGENEILNRIYSTYK